MPRTAGQPSSVLAYSYKVLWFPPDRPVEGNTIFVRSSRDYMLAEDLELVTRSDADE